MAVTEIAAAYGVRRVLILLANSENVRQTSVCRSFRQCAIGGSQRQTEVYQTFPTPFRLAPEFASSIRPRRFALSKRKAAGTDTAGKLRKCPTNFSLSKFSAVCDWWKPATN